ncbi:WD repeat domain-containing protein 83-like [Phalaenopsis equestris]|uniref:WD repeat domain-containing protein 83-like n=1 Tax=Phalaenopsis equestris TaxID=78828 RepID=UPI0009E57AE5|nr:WD repeat domain-containing protein 83-like [Phalaenopsis equestris]
MAKRCCIHRLFTERDNAKLCSCGGDLQVFTFDVVTVLVMRKFRGHDSEVNAVKFNEYGSVVVSAVYDCSFYDCSLRAWDCRSHSTGPIQVNAVKFNEYGSVDRIGWL